MPRPRVVMRKIREVLRLTLGEHFSQRRVRQITSVPEATIYDYLRRAAGGKPCDVAAAGGHRRRRARAPPVRVGQPTRDHTSSAGVGIR
jgi:hypothetical protein